MQRLLSSNNNWNHLCLGMFLLHYIASPETHDLMSNFVCPCPCLTWFFLCVFQLVFEALHSQEPRGYVVGWIIAISLLVGILIFLLLAVLLWKVNTWTLRLWSHKTVLCWSCDSKQEGVVTSSCVWLRVDDGTVSSCRETAGGRGGGGGVSLLWALNNHEKDKSQTGQ